MAVSTRSWQRRQETREYVFEKLINAGCEKGTARRVANTIFRNGYESLAELQADLKKKNWWKDKHKIGIKTAQLIEQEFAKEENK